MFTALLGAVSQGILWGVMVLGVYITYKLLDIPDLTADGSFAFGGCVCAVMIVNFHMNPLAALICDNCRYDSRIYYRSIAYDI